MVLNTVGFLSLIDEDQIISLMGIYTKIILVFFQLETETQLNFI